jgi:hypothetical protein
MRRTPAFALVELPKMLLPVALRHQHVDYLNARRVQTLIHIHGSDGFHSEPRPDDPQLKRTFIRITYNDRYGMWERLRRGCLGGG